jgi:hypothetical protein
LFYFSIGKLLRVDFGVPRRRTLDLTRLERVKRGQVNLTIGYLAATGGAVAPGA